MNATSGILYVVEAGNNTIRAGTLPAVPATITVSSIPANGGAVTGGGGLLIGESVRSGDAKFRLSVQQLDRERKVVSTSASYTFTLGANTAWWRILSAARHHQCRHRAFAVGQAGRLYGYRTGYPAPTFSASGQPAWAIFDTTNGVLAEPPPTQPVLPSPLLLQPPTVLYRMPPKRSR